jgi:tripartite-type tricarboxylate transporter receptor subunit TctC
MKLPRRQFLRLAAGAATLPALSRVACAQPYPSRPVRLIFGFPAGSGADIIARLISQWLSERLGQPFIVENRLGATSNIATEAVVNAPADGHTLLVVTTANAINATTYERLNFNFLRDIAPVAGMTRAPFVMLVNPSLPARTVPEFIAHAKANPGMVNFASAGVGGISHVCGELLKVMTGINMHHVPYRGDTPALIDLLSGQVHLYFGTLTASTEHISTGRLRALAVTTATRWEALPDIPALAEFVRGFEASAMNGLGAPKGTSADVINKINKQVNAALADPKIKARLGDLGATVLPGSPADFGKLVADETEKWAAIVRTANIRMG